MPESHMAILAAWLLTQLLASVTRKTEEDSLSHWAPAPNWEMQQHPLAWAWPRHGCYSSFHLGNENQQKLESISFLLPATLPFKYIKYI